MATQTINDMSVTWNSGATTFDAIKMNVTDTSSAAASSLMCLQVGGADKLDVGKDGALTVTSAAADALAVGLNGATNPALKVDASTASMATGLLITGKAAAAGCALSVISSGTNEALTIDAKGSGTITLGGTSTGAITLTRAATCSATLGVTGAATLASTLDVAGDVAVNTDKFTVAASSGNTAIDGTLSVAGATTQTGALTLGAGLIASVQDLEGAGAVNVTTLVTKVTTTGADALTLADGAEGQIKHIVMVADGGDGTLTPTNFGNGSTITFADAGDAVTLAFLDSNWWVMGSQGSPAIA